MLGTLRSRPGRAEMSHMRIFTDEEMQALRPATREYSLVLLKAGPNTAPTSLALSSGNTAGATSACAKRDRSPSCAP